MMPKAVCRVDTRTSSARAQSAGPVNGNADTLQPKRHADPPLHASLYCRSLLGSQVLLVKVAIAQQLSGHVCSRQ